MNCTNGSVVCTECGVCANRLRQEHSEGAGDPEEWQPARHHRAESRCEAHTQVAQRLPTWRQLRHNPHRHGEEHCPRPGQDQRGRTTSAITDTWLKSPWSNTLRGKWYLSMLVKSALASWCHSFVWQQMCSFTACKCAFYVSRVQSGQKHRAVLPGYLSSLPHLFQPRAECRSSHGGGSLEQAGEGKMSFWSSLSWKGGLDGNRPAQPRQQGEEQYVRNSLRSATKSSQCRSGFNISQSPQDRPWKVIHLGPIMVQTWLLPVRTSDRTINGKYLSGII